MALSESKLKVKFEKWISLSDGWDFLIIKYPIFHHTLTLAEFFIIHLGNFCCSNYRIIYNYYRLLLVLPIHLSKPLPSIPSTTCHHTQKSTLYHNTQPTTPISQCHNSYITIYSTTSHPFFTIPPQPHYLLASHMIDWIEEVRRISQIADWVGFFLFVFIGFEGTPPKNPTSIYLSLISLYIITILLLFIMVDILLIWSILHLSYIYLLYCILYKCIGGLGWGGLDKRLIISELYKLWI